MRERGDGYRDKDPVQDPKTYRNSETSGMMFIDGRNVVEREPEQ